MNREQILQQLQNERDRLDRAIEALSSGGGVPSPFRQGRKKGGITAAGRKKLSDMMKARWAARRAKAAGKAAKKAAAKKK